MAIERRLQLVECTIEDSWVASAIKVAFATNDMKHVNQHFGASRSFAIYAVDQDRACLMEAAEFGELAMDSNEEKLAVKIEVLEDCIAVYSQAIGASAINKLRAEHIQPIKVAPGTPISELLASLQDELKLGQSGWLVKAVERADPSRFNRMEEEGWEE
jgi:nitrogen fixation protein NifX